MDRIITRERIPSRDPRLGRHVNHDSMSRLFPYRAKQRTLRSVLHEAHMPILDQGSLGSCTGHAGVGCLGRGGFFTTVNDADRYQLDSAGAVALYSRATQIDPFAGEYPPTDTGSDGLSVAKALHEVGEIAGYLWTFTLKDALDALQDQPLITGTVWRSDMFSPDPGGVVKPAGSVVGGHEYVADEYQAERGLVGFTNSWGLGWGARGRFYMAAEDWGTLLDQQGDVTVFVPATDLSPEPAEQDPDEVFADVLRPWVARPRGCNRKVRAAGRTWLAAKGLM